MHLATVAKKWEGYMNCLDKRRREVFDYMIFELAGRREETLVMHMGSHSEAVLMNILIEQEIRIRALESRSGINTPGK